LNYQYGCVGTLIAIGIICLINSRRNKSTNDIEKENLIQPVSNGSISMIGYSNGNGMYPGVVT